MDTPAQAQYIATIKAMTLDERDKNIWSLRITCTPAYTQLILLAPTNSGFDYPMTQFLTDLNCIKFPKILCYRETAITGKEHYHLRIASTVWKTRKSLYDIVKKHFPMLKGNGAIGTQRVQEADTPNPSSRVQKSISYVCKDHHRVYTRGYPPETLAVFEKIGAAWQDNSKLPAYKRIIIDKGITDQHHGGVVVRHVLNWYKENKRDLPTPHALQKVLTNIKLHVDKQFHRQYLLQNVEFYDTLMQRLN